jgi:DNA adenine methylase
MSLIRYPGAKEKLADTLLALFPARCVHRLWSHASPVEYREPFFGSGAIGLKILPQLPRTGRVWINDLDQDLASLWLSVRDHHRLLIDRIKAFTPSIEAFYEYKAMDGTAGDVVDRGFRKLALHRMSVSGFGVKSGGPIGGRSQAGKLYTVECRWNPSRMRRDIVTIHGLFRSFDEVTITCGDFAPLFEDASSGAFIYADPPYYAKGGQLYKHNMTDADHVRLCQSANDSGADCVISYDDHPRIRDLYRTHEIHELRVTYSNAIQRGGIRPKNKEIGIVISPNRKAQ